MSSWLTVEWIRRDVSWKIHKIRINQKNGYVNLEIRKHSIAALYE